MPRDYKELPEFSKKYNGCTVRIDRVDYGVGMVFDNYQDCMHAAKREIWRMISPATVDEKVGDMQ